MENSRIPFQSRKKQRKLQREEKKKRKDLYHRNNGKKKMLQQQSKKTEQKQKIQKNKKLNFDNKIKSNEDKISKFNPKRSADYIEHQRKLIREEEKEIKKYEKLLKLKSYTKRNKLPKSFYMDGLADLIEICDGRFRPEDDEDEEKYSKFNKGKPKIIKTSKNDEYNDDFDEDDDDFDEEDNGNQDADDEQMEDEDNDDDESDNDNGKDDKPEYHEDIYGFIRDKHGNIVKQEKNIRKEQLMSDVVVDENLQRKIRGLLNRLTSSNIKVISRQIIDLNKTHSRHVINKAIMNCIDATIIGTEHCLPSKLVAEIAMLISILYFEMGEDVGGYFIHSIISRFDQVFSNESCWNSSKKLNNILTLILNVHVTGMIDCQLVYDILDKFCDQFDNEKSIEIIDSILKTSGFLLRKEDPLKMKALILKIHEKSHTVQNLNGSRMKFMLESLVAIKNNNVSKIKTTETMVMNDLIESTLKGVIKKTRVPSIPGQYSAVLQSSHWFSYTKEIVPLDSIKISDEVVETKVSNDTNIDYNLRDRICKALRINTPLRRDLFTAMFACNDYIDAAGKLISIGKKQSSEIINVVLHVAINERRFNEFYFYLLQHLTNIDRKYKVALDFAIRDKISDLGSLSKQNQQNLQKLMVELLKTNCLAITCLKVIEFTDMNETYVQFIKGILDPIFNENQTVIADILSKIQKKDNFASAIKLFITCFMDSNAKHQASSIGQLQAKLRI